jgi:hypothetical protein
MSDEAHRVQSVREEYAELGRSRCECGGSYRLVMQRLMQFGEQWTDLLDTKCSRCGAERSFAFNVSSRFGEHGSEQK